MSMEEALGGEGDAEKGIWRSRKENCHRGRTHGGRNWVLVSTGLPIRYSLRARTTRGFRRGRGTQYGGMRAYSPVPWVGKDLLRPYGRVWSPHWKSRKRVSPTAECCTSGHGMYRGKGSSSNVFGDPKPSGPSFWRISESCFMPAAREGLRFHGRSRQRGCRRGACVGGPGPREGKVISTSGGGRPR